MEQTSQLRSSGIGGSDMAVILGLNPWKTPIDLYEEKVGIREPFAGNRFTEAGNRLEDVIAQWYADETGGKVARANQTYRLKDHPFVMAHIDRRVLKQRKVLECKSADKWTITKWGEHGTNDVPDSYFIQVQHYLMFPYWDTADLAALIGGNDFRIYHIDPDKELQDMMLEAAIEFWRRIQTGEYPDPINEADANKKWSRDDGSVIYATEEVLAWERDLKASIVQEKELKNKIDDLKLEIKSFMGEHSILLDPATDKKIHQWKVQNLSSFGEKQFEIDYPDLYKKCLVPKFDRKALKTINPDLYKDYQAKGRVFR
jgi:putative phage-type endonuclease